MQRKVSAFLALSGAEPPRATGGLPCVWLGYRVENGRLVRRGLPPRARGGLLGITAAGDGGDPERIAREIGAACRYRAMGGVFWDLPEGSGTAPVRQVGSRLAHRGLRQLVPLHLAEVLPEARVLIPGAVTGGSYQELLEVSAARFGPGRCWLEPVRLACDFCMPAHDAHGVRLGPADLAALLAQNGGESWFCPTLCTRYFTYTAGEDSHFVLFDDPAAAGERLRRAAEAGFSGFLIRRRDWPEQLPPLP